MKKLLALVLAVLMVLSMVACNNTPVETNPTATQGGSATQPKETEPAAKDPVTITYWYPGFGEMEDSQKVEDKLNEILKTIPGYEHITIDLQCQPLANYATSFTLAQANKEQIDLVASYSLNMSNLWNNGDIVPLDDLLEKYPNVVSEIPDWMVDMGLMYGEQAYIPSQQQATTMYFWKFFKSQMDPYLEAYRITLDDVKAIITDGNPKAICDFLEEYVLFQRSYSGVDTIFARKTLTPKLWTEMEFVYIDNGNLVLREGGDKVEWTGMMAAYQYVLGRMAEWYDEGILCEDPTAKVSGSKPGQEYSYCWAENYNVATEEMMSEIYPDPECYFIAARSDYYIPSVYAAGGTFIYADCAHPEEAMMIMELLHSSVHGVEFYNTLAWGLEGEHWEWEDKEAKRIKTLEFDAGQGTSTCTYAAYPWALGNSFNAYQNQATRPGQVEYKIQVHNDPTTTPSPAMGITWDLTGIEDIYLQCKAISEEYDVISFYTLGAEGWKARYDEYITKMKVAGIDVLLAELTDQLEEYLANKG